MKNELLKFSEYEKRKNRRKSINEAMSELIESGKDCRSCVGHCCTFEHNSMQVSPLEALDVYSHLLEAGRVTPELIEQLEENVSNFRLNIEPLAIGKKTLRRYYTCPFYQDHALGCSIDRDSKPYGCLAFNPTKEEVSQPGFCLSNSQVLSSQDQVFGESEQRDNNLLKAELGIYWDKMNLPNALSYLIKSFGKLSEKN